MRIIQQFQAGRPSFSIEVFPPKTGKGVETLKEKLAVMARFQPDFISVTYGAGGGTRDTTGLICGHIKNRLKVEVLAHLTCIGHTPQDIVSVLESLEADAIENIMALRGDPPPGETYQPPTQGLRYASDLVRLLKKRGGQGIAVAGYPEGHVEAVSFEADLAHLKEKVEAGADFIITQYFLDNGVYFRWLERIRRMGIAVPVVAGVMPAQSLEQISRFSKFCGAQLPPALSQGLERFKEDAEGAARFGLEYAQEQVRGLLAQGVDGIHLYALNKSEPVEAIAPLVMARR